jgi:hypothetical protein
MTIEAKLDRIIELLEARQAAAPAPVAAPVQAAPAPAPKAAPVVAAPVEVVVPVAVAPVVAPAPTTDCPIVDQPSLVAYVMGSYKEMGPVKGNMIQGVLAGQGITNINDAKPEQYAAIYAGVEALKAQ